MKKLATIIVCVLTSVTAWSINDIVLTTLKPGAKAITWVSGGGNNLVAQFAPSTWTPITNLVAHWKMNDNAASTTVLDSYSNNNGVAASNTSVLTVEGKINTALNFQDLPVAVSGFTNIVGNADYTLSVWVKISAWQESNGDAVMLWRGAEGMRAAIGFGYTSNGMFVYHYQDDIVYPNGGPTVLNTFYHCATTYIASTRVGNVFLNGVSLGTKTFTGDLNITQNGFYIGHDNGGTYNRHMHGVLDDVRIYSRVLSSNEIAAIYNAGAGTEAE